MDTIPDHTREKVLRANGTIDWMTEEWIRRAIKGAEAGFYETEARAHAGRVARRAVGAFISAHFAALLQRPRRRERFRASRTCTDVRFEG